MTPSFIVKTDATWLIERQQAASRINIYINKSAKLGQICTDAAQLQLFPVFAEKYRAKMKCN